MSEFDKLSSNYKQLLDRDIRLFGEDSEYFASYKAMFVYKYLGDSFIGDILDYGCGIGVVSKFLNNFFKDKNIRMLGYDVSAESIKEARNNVNDVEFTENFDDVKNRKFDAIIMANVLHHIKAEDRTEVLKKTATCLTKGGKIFVFEHNPYNPLTRIVVKLSIIDRGAVLVKSKDVAVLFRKAGIYPIEKKYIVFFPKILKIFRPLESLLGNFPIGAQYVFIGKVL